MTIWLVNQEAGNLGFSLPTSPTRSLKLQLSDFPVNRHVTRQALPRSLSSVPFDIAPLIFWKKEICRARN